MLRSFSELYHMSGHYKMFYHPWEVFTKPWKWSKGVWMGI